MSACPHGFPSPASCGDCLLDGPVAPARPGPEQLLRASRSIRAKYETRCARRWEHLTALGERIYWVEGVGWCCGECAR